MKYRKNIPSFPGSKPDYKRKTKPAAFWKAMRLPFQHDHGELLNFQVWFQALQLLLGLLGWMRQLQPPGKIPEAVAAQLAKRRRTGGGTTGLSPISGIVPLKSNDQEGIMRMLMEAGNDVCNPNDAKHSELLRMERILHQLLVVHPISHCLIIGSGVRPTWLKLEHQRWRKQLWELQSNTDGHSAKPGPLSPKGWSANLLKDRIPLNWQLPLDYYQPLFVNHGLPTAINHETHEQAFSTPGSFWTLTITRVPMNHYPLITIGSPHIC